MRWQLILPLFILGITGCLSNVPPSYNGPSGMLSIQFDSANANAVYNHITGGRALEAAFDYSDRQNIEDLTVLRNSNDSIGVFAIDTAQKHRMITLSASEPPFLYVSDSGTVTITAETEDSIAGSFSVRMIGGDSSVHHVSGTFVAVPAPQNPG